MAPTSTTVPSSTTGRKPSCWARLKRWISSTNSKVAWPPRRRLPASSNVRLRSATPENTAESWTKCSPARAASNRAIVVLPTPGGPHRIREASEPRSSMRVSVPSGPSRWSWPTTSSNSRGRSRSARGLAARTSGVSGTISGPNRSSGSAGLGSTDTAEYQRWEFWFLSGTGCQTRDRSCLAAPIRPRWV